MFTKLLFLNEYRKYISNKIPDIFKDLNRNYDVLLLGDYSIVKEMVIKKGKVLDCSNYYRNFYTDNLIAKRYYSMLRKNGTIRIFVDVNNKKYFSSRKISPFDFGFLHQITLMEERTKINSISHKLNMMLNGIRLKKIEKKSNNKGIGNYIKEKYDSSRNKKNKNEMLYDLKKFCEEREILLDIIEVNKNTIL